MRFLLGFLLLTYLPVGALAQDEGTAEPEPNKPPPYSILWIS